MDTTRKAEVAVIILNKSCNEKLFLCIDSIIGYTRNVKCNIYIGDTGSSDKELFDIQAFIECKRLTCPHDIILLANIGPYNYAANTNYIINFCIQNEKYIMFCNNDIILKSPVIDSCYELYTRTYEGRYNTFGTIGCRLIYPNGNIQHDGQAVFLRHNAPYEEAQFIITHNHLHIPCTQFINDNMQVVDGNTFALCFTSRLLFLEVNGLDNQYHKCFEDLQYNLELKVRGLSNILLPTNFYAIHDESYTRKKVDTYIDQADYCRIIHYIKTVYWPAECKKNIPSQIG